MLATRVEELMLGSGMSMEDAKSLAEQELILKASARLDAMIRATTCSACGTPAVQALGLCGRCYRRDLRRRQRIKTKVCLQCNLPFQATRNDAFLCSGKCRKARMRTRIRDAEAGLSRTPATIAGNGHAALVTVAQNYEDPFEARRRELAIANDKRNASAAVYHPSAAVDRMVSDMDREAGRKRWNDWCRSHWGFGSWIK